MSVVIEEVEINPLPSCALDAASEAACTQAGDHAGPMTQPASVERRAEVAPLGTRRDLEPPIARNQVGTERVLGFSRKVCKPASLLVGRDTEERN